MLGVIKNMMTASEDRLVKKVSLVELIGRPLNLVEQKYGSC